MQEDSVKEQEELEEVVKSRKLPALWTRVISLRHDSLDDLKTYTVHQDLQLAGHMVRAPLRRYKPGDGEPIFWPDDFFEGREALSLD